MTGTFRFYRSVRVGTGTSLHDAFRNKLGDPPYSIVENVALGTGFWDYIHDARPVRYTLAQCEPATHALIAADAEIIALSPELADAAALQAWLDGTLSSVPQAVRDQIEADGISVAWASAQTTRREAFRYLSKVHVSTQDLRRLKDDSSLQVFAAVLDNRINTLPAGVRTSVSQWMQSKGLDTTWIVPSQTTVRQVIHYIVQNINWPVLPFRSDMPL